jgi:COMPASS component SWD2
LNVIDNYALPSSHPRPPIQPEWTSIKFSNDGDKILVTTSGDVHYVTDAYNTDMKRRLIGHVGLNNALQLLGGEETSWTPDGRFVVGGNIILYNTI